MAYEIFKKLCDQNHIRPADVTKATGISSATFTSWKQGKYEPKLDKMQLIADYFGVSVGYLMNGEENESYYTDGETAKIMQKLFETPGKRTLAKAVADMSERQAVAFFNMIQELTGDNNENNQDA